MKEAEIIARFSMLESEIAELRQQLEALRNEQVSVRDQVHSVPTPDFSGIAYVMGKRLAVSGTPNKWIRVNFSNITAIYTGDEPPDPFPINEEWYATAETIGDIHCGPR